MNRQKRRRPPWQAAPGKVQESSNSRTKNNRGSRQHKAARTLPSTRHLPLGNPDQRWFKAHPHRKFRLRPKRSDEPGTGYLILKRLSYGDQLRVDIGPGGAMLDDNDETLGKVYRFLRADKRSVLFPHGGTVVGWGES